MEREYEEILEEQLKNLDLTSLDKLMGIGNQLGLPDYSLVTMIKNMIDGEPLFNIEDVVYGLKDIFFSEIHSSFTLGVQILIICIIMGMLQNLTNSYGENTVSQIGAMICNCTVVALCLVNITDVYSLSGNTINQMAGVIQMLLPIMIPLLIAMGGPTTGALLSPVILAVIGLFGTIIQKIIMPCLFLACAFLLVNSLTRRDYVKKLALLMRNGAIFVVGLAVTLFSGLTALQGLGAKMADGILIKTARFSLDNFIPIIGGFASDSVEMVLSCAAIIKNAIGIVGLLAILSLLLIPLLKLMAIALIYKVAAVLIEPIGNQIISDCLNEVGNTVIIMGVVVLLSAILFLIFLTILISMGTAPW
ncbi:MAG: stage III sporulation protein AE [Anaerovoracaceae bacterium]|jgi:stage III sporulation protein AE